MSLENKKTVNVYKQYAKKYLECNRRQELVDIKKAEEKKAKLQAFLKKHFDVLPLGSKVLEIGAGDGNLSKYLETIGYDVTASDVADDFLLEIKKRGVNAIKFNLLEDIFTNQYYGILCWRVFVHFTKEDIKISFEKIYNALENGGVFIFNVKNKEVEDIKGEWIDYPDEFHMGVERYFNNFYKEEIDELINDIGYKLVSFHTEGGENNNKWLVYVLKK